jgi:proline iminopeptidase
MKSGGAKLHILLLLRAAVALPLATSCAANSLAPQGVIQRASLQPGVHEVELNGARVWYRVAGTWDGRSAPVVFLAGGPGGNSYSFEKVGGPQLEPANLIVYYDQRGTGRSERPASGDYAIATLVDDIEALRRHLGVPKISLIAHSFGAVLALEYAAKFADRVEAAVLAGPLWNAPFSCGEHIERLAELRPDVYRSLRAEGEYPQIEACERSFRSVPGREGERITQANMFPNPQTRELLQRLESEGGLKNTGELGQAVFQQGLLRYGFLGAHKVTAPVLVIGGSRDFAAGPRTQRALARVLPRGRFLEYQGSGHWMFLEHPERFARDVSAFFATAPRQRQ